MQKEDEEIMVSKYERVFKKAYSEELKKEKVRKERAKIQNIKLKAKEMARSGKVGYYAKGFATTMARGAQRAGSAINKLDQKGKKKKGNPALRNLQGMTDRFFR